MPRRRSPSVDRTDAQLAAHFPDTVIELQQGEGVGGAVVVEVQCARNESKRRSWPLYVAATHARLGCPVLLLVITTSHGLSEWAATPIDVGHPGWLLRPLVLGPDELPMITDPSRAGEHLELATLRALASARLRSRRAARVVSEVAQALARVDDPRATQYIRLVLHVLGPSLRAEVEELMKSIDLSQPSDLERRLTARARAEAKAEDVLAVLAARGLEVPEAVRERVQECTDLAQLDAWHTRAVTAERAEDIFEPS